MSQNLVIPNKDNKVVFVFTGIDLTSNTNIVVNFGGETFSIADDPTLVVVSSATELSLNLSGTAEVGKVFATVTYFDGASVNGTDITSRSLGNSSQIVVAVGSQLIIETGTIVAGANSFATDAELILFANLRGVSVPATQPAREALLILAMDYIKGRESNMKGDRVTQAQPLPYPRYDVNYHNFYLESNKIPSQLKDAQIELAIQASTSDLLVSETTTNLASFNVDGVYSESYFSGGSWSTVRTDKADAYLDVLMRNGGAYNMLTRV